jgi:hypothetical protein
MMIYMNARLRLVTTKRINTKDGKPMTTGFGYADIQGEMGFPLGLVCWGDMAGELARYSKGDTLTVSGRLQANDYTSKNGEDVKGYQLIVEGLMGVKRTAAFQDEVKPKKRNPEDAKPHPNQAGGIRFDEVPNF